MWIFSPFWSIVLTWSALNHLSNIYNKSVYESEVKTFPLIQNINQYVQKSAIIIIIIYSKEKYQNYSEMYIFKTLLSMVF